MISDRDVLSAFATSGYAEAFHALQAISHSLSRRMEFDLDWVVNAVISLDIGAPPDQCVCYALGDPYPLRPSDEERAAALAKLDAEAVR